MLYTSEIVIFVSLGLVFAAGLAVLARWSEKGAPRVAAYALIAVAFLYVGLAIRSTDPSMWIGVEMTGVAIFGSLALMSIIGSPWYVVAGLALHTLWAIQYHYVGTGSAFTPAPIALATAGFDVAAALYVAFVAWRASRAAKAAPASAPAPQLAARSRNRDKSDA
jgi:hypothetical protein